MHSFRALGGLAVLGVAASACSPSSTDLSGGVSITTAPVPTRYAAPLPTTSMGLREWVREGSGDIAPVSHVVDSVLTGRSAWIVRLATAADAVAEPDREAWVGLWTGWFELGVATPSFCAETRAAMAGASSAFRDAISLPFARTCARSGDVSLVLREDTPSRAVLEYFSWAELASKAPPFDPLLADAARDVIVNGEAFEARMAAFTLIDTQDDRAEAALLEIHAGLDDRARADEVALAFLSSDNDEGKARAQAACRRRPDDLMCSPPEQTFAESFDEEVEDETVPETAIAARILELADMGFSKVRAVGVADVSTDAADEILLAAGQAHWFDVETGFYPNQHDSLLRYLAALVSPDLDDVVFEEIPPELDDESAPYELLAYSGGKLLRIEAQNLGDWYDVGAVLELLNAVLTQRNHTARVTVLATGDQTAIVVAAPPAALARAAEAGLIEIVDAREAERVGKEFEEEVRRSLEE